MKLIASFLLFLFSQACSQPAPQPIVTDCNLPSPTTDSAQLADFKQHMVRREAPQPLIPDTDTIYCLRGRSGWGVFDYLCSIYNDSTGYKAAFIHMYNPDNNSTVHFEEQIKPISPLTWKQIQNEFDAQGFWCISYIPDRRCIDANEYYLWGREGEKFRLVNWNGCEPNLDSLRIIGKKLRDLCGFTPATGEVTYTIKRDSVYASIYSTDLELGIFTKETEIYYNGKPLRISDGLARLVVPRKDFNNLKKAEIIEYGIDGSVHRFRVSELREENK